VRSGKKKSSINLLAAARRKRRRNRWLIGVMILASLLVVGFSFAEATTQVRLRAVVQPTVRPGPQVADFEESGSGKHLNVERANATQVVSTPAAPENSCDDLSVLVDRSHTLPPDYAPDDLVSLSEYRVPTLGGGEMLLRREAAGHLRRLVKDAAADGEELVVASAYRSYAHQQASYARLTSIYGTEAGEMSATPGHSQHQLGTAVDFTNAAAGYEIWDYFGDTSAYLWLKNHAREYGFVLAYPQSKEAETGYQWEPWHYRYVGTKNAERLEASGLSLQEFLAREGVLPRC
jgi:D-alanyl-D-alanine carboxypeptidase